MADYKFDKPWAAESQNVKTFTEEEWGTGIVEKSLVSSSQVNGVMQQVTSRFLELEAVEDRQYRYDFIVDDELSFQKFLSGDFGNSKSILFRTGKWQTEEAVDLSKKELQLIRLESTAHLNLSGGCVFSNIKPQIQSGYFQETINYTNAIFNAVHFSSYNYTFVNSYIINSTLYSASIGKFSGGIFQNCLIIIDSGTITNATFTDCKFEQSPTFENCTLIRCIIPNNIKLTNCTVIDCDYTVNAYKANLVTGTTFRNCNLSFTTSGAETTPVCDNSNKANGSRITFKLSKSEHVSMIIYDSQIMYSAGDGLFTDSQFFGTSYMDVSGVANIALINLINRLENSKGSILTSIPFFRDGSNFRTYGNSTDYLYPGVINKVTGNNDRAPRGTYYAKQKFFVQFTGNVSTTPITYGLFKFIPWCEYTDGTLSPDNDAYNIEFIISQTLNR